MRFMMIVKADGESESRRLPTADELKEMGEYNEKLAKAGVMLAGEGLHPSERGARIRFSSRKPTVVDGPFTESKELIAGFWIIDVPSREAAIDWAKQIPFVDGEVELRQVFEAEDFGDSYTPEVREQEDRIRARIKAR